MQSSASASIGIEAVMSSNQEFDVAVVGATGAVGEVMLRLLEERAFPVRTLHPLASERSAGSTIMFRVRPSAFKTLPRLISPRFNWDCSLRGEGFRRSTRLKRFLKVVW